VEQELLDRDLLEEMQITILLLVPAQEAAVVLVRLATLLREQMEAQVALGSLTLTVDLHCIGRVEVVAALKEEQAP
jgi:hypothetical protein